MVITFDENNWQNVLASFYADRFINHCNGRVKFTTDQIILFGTNHRIAIPYNDITSVGVLKYCFGISRHIRIQTANDDLYFILLPNEPFYIEKILERSPNAALCSKIKKNPIYYFLNIFFLTYLFFLLISLYNLDHALIQKQMLPLLLNVFLIGLLPTMIIYSILIKKTQTKKPQIPYLKFILIIWLIPLLGLYICNMYFMRYKTTCILD